MCEKCLLCENEGTKSFYDNAGSMYDMKRIDLMFDNLCHKCWSDVCVLKSDLTTIAVQYHEKYYSYKSAEDFLKENIQLDDNNFGRSNPISRDGKKIFVGDRRKEIIEICKSVLKK
jgi:hypothetical protein